MSKKAAIILINYKDYAEKFLNDCIQSIGRQDYKGKLKVFIVDNETSEKSFRAIADILNKAENKIPPAPFYKGGSIEIIRNEKNDGFAKGNNDAMKVAIERGYEYIILFNMDTVIEPDCVGKMVKIVENPPDPLSQGREIGAVQARLMLWQDKEKINSLGNVTHFLGFGYSDGYNERWDELKSPSPPLHKGGRYEICYPSGAAVLFRAEVLKRVGLFDEEFWMYNEDQDLGWRIWLAGYKCVLAPSAVVYHKYEFSRSIKKYYWMDRNRILAMLKNYHLLTLILITPACIVMDLGLLLFSFTNGWFKEKLKVYKYFLSLKNWRYILMVRRETQELRKVKDRDIIKMFSGKIWYQEVDDVKLRMINPFFSLYWRIVKNIIKIFNF